MTILENDQNTRIDDYKKKYDDLQKSEIDKQNELKSKIDNISRKSTSKIISTKKK